MIAENIWENSDFVSKIPERYKRKKAGILFFAALSKHIGFPMGIKDLPWEYRFYEGHSGESLEISMEQLQSVSWLKNTRIISERYFVDGDTPKRSAILLKRGIG